MSLLIPRVLFDVLPSDIHGKGLFATEMLEPGQLICEEVVQSSQMKEEFLFDGPLRWVNHSASPNAFIKIDFVGQKLRLRLYSAEKIFSGEEITYDYSLMGHRGRAVACLCGRPGCSGYFHLRSEFGEHR